MKKLILPVFAILLLASCAAKQTAAKDNSLYEVLTAQPDGGGNIRFFEILSKPDEINMLKGDPHVKNKIEDVDIQKSNFLVMNMGEKSSGGYAIGVESMEETDEKIIITVKETEPKPGDMVTQNITYPYCIVKINSKKPITIK